MRLTVLSVSYPLAQVSAWTAGGAEQILGILDSALVKAGHRSLVLAPAGSRCKGLLIPVQIPNGVLDNHAKREARRSFKQAIDRALDGYSVDLVHMHGIDFHEYLPDREIPIVITLHLPLSWYSPLALRSTTRNLRLVCVSKSQVRTAPSGVPIDKVILNGVELEKFRPPRRRSNYVLVMTRICPEKGIHLAIDAAERADIDLIIAGSVFEYPEHQAYFDCMIRPRLNERTRFIGPVGGHRKAALLAGARCLLVPSLAPETSSLVAMEAMAAGTPVIAFPNGALPEIVGSGRTGFLVNDADQMADAIKQVDSISAHDCRDEAQRRFSATRMFSDYMDLHRSMKKTETVSELQAA